MVIQRTRQSTTCTALRQFVIPDQLLDAVQRKGRRLRAVVAECAIQHGLLSLPHHIDSDMPSPFDQSTHTAHSVTLTGASSFSTMSVSPSIPLPYFGMQFAPPAPYCHELQSSTGSTVHYHPTPHNYFLDPLGRPYMYDPTTQSITNRPNSAPATHRRHSLPQSAADWRDGGALEDAITVGPRQWSMAMATVRASQTTRGQEASYAPSLRLNGQHGRPFCIAGRSISTSSMNNTRPQLASRLHEMNTTVTSQRSPTSTTTSTTNTSMQRNESTTRPNTAASSRAERSRAADEAACHFSGQKTCPQPRRRPLLSRRRPRRRLLHPLPL